MGRETRDLCLHELFVEQARRSPRATALVDPSGELTYAALDRRSDLLASCLRGAGTVPDGVVGVYMERCAEYVIACLAALKAGGAYLPLDLAYPGSLLGEVVADSEPRVVLTKERYAARLCLDEGWETEICGLERRR